MPVCTTLLELCFSFEQRSEGLISTFLLSFSTLSISTVTPPPRRSTSVSRGPGDLLPHSRLSGTSWRRRSTRRPPQKWLGTTQPGPTQGSHLRSSSSNSTRMVLKEDRPTEVNSHQTGCKPSPYSNNSFSSSNRPTSWPCSSSSRPILLPFNRQ